MPNNKLTTLSKASYPPKTHKIELTETQLRYLAKALEQHHRFVCGQPEDLVGEVHARKEAKDLEKIDPNFIKHVLFPELAPGQSYGFNHEPMGYCLYRTILEYFNKDANNVYSYPTDALTAEGKITVSEIK